MQSDDIAKATEELAQRLRVWRQDHKAPTRIPSEYWDQAVNLAGLQGVSKTAQALRLDYMSLKRRVGGPIRTRERDDQTATFLEWLQPLPNVIADCNLRVTSASGAKLSARMKNLSPAALGSLLRDFVGLP